MRTMFDILCTFKFDNYSIEKLQILCGKIKLLFTYTVDISHLYFSAYITYMTQIVNSAKTEKCFSRYKK